MKSWPKFVAALAVVGVVVSAWACDGNKPPPPGAAQTTADSGGSPKDRAGCGGAAKEVAAKNAADREGCTGAGKSVAAVKGMPKMTFKVGDQTVACPMKARELAGVDEAKIRFVVSETEYGDKIEALKAYAGVLDKFYGEMTNVRFAVGDQCVGCPKAAETIAKGSGQPVKYRVSSVVFTDQAKAEEAVKAARAAADKVTMTFVADGKSSCCAGAGAAQVAAGGEKKPGQYYVGKVKTKCEATAKVELAKAKIAAAHQAIEQAAEQKVAEKEVAAGA